MGHEADRKPDSAASPRSRLFTVRLWSAAVRGGREYRGNVREVTSGAFRNFRDWSDLAGFLTERMQEDDRTGPAVDGDTPWRQ